MSGADAVIASLRSGHDALAGLVSGLSDDIPAQPDGTLSLPAEARVRLVTGRLGPAYTPAGVTATGAADLDVLRAVFPGF